MRVRPLGGCGFVSVIVLPDHTITRTEEWTLGHGVALRITDTDPSLQAGYFRGARTEVEMRTPFGGTLHLADLDTAIATVRAAYVHLEAVREARSEGRPS